MNWNPFKKNEPEEFFDPLADLILSKLKVGYVVDYDMATWQVTAHSYYEIDGDRIDEWEFSDGQRTLYLEREEDDEVEWAMSEKLALSKIDSDLRGHLKTNEEPPDTLTVDGVSYAGESTAAGEYYKDGKGPGREFVVWDYESKDGRSLSVEQWGESEYEASLGQTVQEYQFSNILPGEA